MDLPAAYAFFYQYKNPKIEAKAMVYQLWISPNKDQVEIVQGNNLYAKLTKENSAILFKVVTEDKLSS
ncbi:hypothetical protein ACQKM9_18515 [Viridibacillus sp. NPDC093762]|uniref:hypothetical protein n=1 Tax=Viridibacillus sp. NPDC093762 TaxID=3390720 RepID=UPI003D022EAF